MYNLAEATLLTRLQFEYCWPDNLTQEFGDLEWPATLHNLQSLEMLGTPNSPPLQLLDYTNLQEFTHNRSGATTSNFFVVPHWFSDMKSLKHLHFAAAVREFPTSLFALTQLHSLSLGYFSDNAFSPVIEHVLPRSIIDFAAWPHLTSLGLKSWSISDGHDDSTDTYLSLIQLKKALGTRSWVLKCDPSL